MKSGTIAIVAGFTMFIASITLADVPGVINYQGRLTDPNGAPVADSSTNNFTFSIFESTNAATPLWAEAHPNVPVMNGLFSVLLGSVTNPLSPTLFATNGGITRWLEVNVNGETLAPRKELVSVAYALQAGNAATLDGFPAREFAAASLTNEIIALQISTNFLLSQTIILQGATNVLQAQAADLQAATGALNTAVGNLNTATGALNIAVGDLQTATNALNIEVGSLQAATNALNLATNALQAQLGVLATSAVTQAQDPMIISNGVVYLDYDTNDFILAGAIQVRDVYVNSAGDVMMGDLQMFGGTVIQGVDIIDSVAIEDLTIASDDIADNAVTTTKLADNAVTSGKINDGAVDTADLADNAVANAKLADNAVTSGKINNGAVAADDLAADAVTTAKLADNAVTSGKINNGAVDTADLADNAVATAKLADNAVTSGKINDGAVDTADLADNAVATAKLADNAVTSGKINDGAVDTADLADNAVATAKLADNAVTSGKINNGAVGTDDLADNAVATAKLADNAVTSGKINNGAVDTADLADNAITTAKIAFETIVNDDISQTANIAAGKINVAGIDHGLLAGRDDDDHTQYLNGTRHAAVNHATVETDPQVHDNQTNNFVPRWDGNNNRLVGGAIVDNGSIGIGGTAGAGYRLDVMGQAIVRDHLTVSGGDIWMSANSKVKAPGGRLDIEAGGNIVLSPAGYVGLGTPSPLAGLDINYRTGPWGSLAIRNTYAGSSTHFDMPDGKNYIRGTTIIADQGGNVGLGTTTPGAKLDVAGDTKLTSSGTASPGTQYASHQLLFDSSSWSTYYNSPVNRQWKIKSIGQTTYYGEPRLSFLSDYDNAERMVINMVNGHVGIGTTSPAAKLHVNGNARVNGSLIIPDNQSINNDHTDSLLGSITLLTFAENHSSGWANVTLLKAPLGGLYVRRSADNAYLMELYGNGSLWTAGGYSSGSDERIKINQRELEYGLAQIMPLKPKRYDRVDYEYDPETEEIVIHPERITKTNEIGLVAQDVQKYIPEAVTVPQDENSGLWSISYDAIVPVLVKAVQEQQAQIEELRKEINDLKSVK